jgi:hypothetical protein
MSWLQEDPLGDIDGPNPYAYVGWDPFNKIDPYGLEAWYQGWGRTIGYMLGGGPAGAAGQVWGSIHSGIDDGCIIVSDALTFGQNENLHNATSQIMATAGEAGLGGFYKASYISGVVGREALVFVATAGIASAGQAGLRTLLATTAGRDTFAAAMIWLGVEGADMALVTKVVQYFLGTVAAAATAEAGEGVVYVRTNPITGEGYVGQSKSMERFLVRQGEHDRLLGVDHRYEILERVNPGDLDMAEESWIRRLGGPKNKGGTLANKRYQVNDASYCEQGGMVPKPTK